jgi:hypothetical protein
MLTRDSSTTVVGVAERFNAALEAVAESTNIDSIGSVLLLTNPVFFFRAQAGDADILDERICGTGR